MKTCGCLRDDVPGRPAEDRVGVDPGDDQRDDHEQDELLEEAEEPEGEERDRGQLGEVREHFEVAERRPARASTPSATRERQQSPRACASGSTSRSNEKTAGIRTSAEEGDVPPGRQRGQRVDRVVPGGQAGRERDERERREATLVRRQLRPPGAEHLEGVPERGLRGLLVERGVDVGDDERLAPSA